MTKKTEKWWNDNALEYQKEWALPIDAFYGPGAPNEESLKLIGDLANKNVLEIGCGGAQCGLSFAKQGAHVIGIDISEEQIKFAENLAKKNNLQIKLYQGDIISLNQIEKNSQDVVFSSWAIQYVDNLILCFREVFRVLKNKGIFVFSMPHPFWRVIDKETMKIKRNYFETKDLEEPSKKGIFVEYFYRLDFIINSLIESGFAIEKIIEADSRKKNIGDPQYDLQEEYRKEAMKLIPRTIIVKARKIIQK